MKLLNDFFFIESAVADETAYVCRVGLRAEHPIYQAHFPGRPVTPGVCIIQMVTECLEQKLGRRLLPSVVKNVKFLSVLEPASTARIDLRYISVSEEETECKVQAIVADDTVQFAKLSIVYAYAERIDR